MACLEELKASNLALEIEEAIRLVNNNEKLANIVVKAWPEKAGIYPHTDRNPNYRNYTRLQDRPGPNHSSAADIMNMPISSVVTLPSNEDMKDDNGEWFNQLKGPPGSRTLTVS